jgi:hypothetical protein
MRARWVLVFEDKSPLSFASGNSCHAGQKLVSCEPRNKEESTIRGTGASSAEFDANQVQLDAKNISVTF